MYNLFFFTEEFPLAIQGEGAQTKNPATRVQV